MKSSRHNYMFSTIGSRWYKSSGRENKKQKVVLTKPVMRKFDDERDQTDFEKSGRIERLGNETHKSTRIKFAAIYDDEEEIGKILNSEASVSSVQTLLSMRDKHGQPCIFYALESRSKKALACLLRHVNDKACLISSNSETVLHVATKIGDVDMLRSVLPVVDLVGDIVDHVDEDNGRTPLHLAAKFNHVEIAKELLIHGAKLDLVDATKKTPILMAALKGHASMLQIFLEYGRERIEILFLGSCLPWRRYGNLLQVAVESGDERTVQVCLDQDPEIVRKCLEQDMEHGEGGLLHSACENGMEQCVVYAIETMKDQAELYMSRKDRLGFAAIHKAAINNHDHLMKYLGSSKLCVNQTTSYSQTALVLAAEQGHIKVVEELLNLEADFRITDDIGRTVLHYATAFPNVLRILLQKKDLCQLLINAKEKDGYTPVHMAALNGLHESLNVLLEYGADIKVFTNASRSPLHCAASSECLEVVQLVLATEPAFVNKVDATGKTPLHTAANYGSSDVVKCLLDYGALVIKDTNMYSALHIAANKGHLDVIQLLIAAKSNIINWENKFKRTALIAAASTGKSDVVKFLLESGAAVTQDYELFNCFDWCLIRNCKDTAMTIMCNSRWKEILDSTRHGSEGTMAKLVQKMPEVANRVLSNSMTSQGHPDTKQYVKCYDFLCLQDISQDNPGVPDTIETNKCKPLTAIETMINTECYSCLCHAVCCKFLKSKWMEFGWKIHTFSLVLYIAFLASFTAYAFRLVSYDTRTKTSSVNDEADIDVAKVICVLFTSVNAFKEVIQLFSYKGRYFQGKTNYLECAMHVSVFIFVAKTDSNAAVKTSVQWHACSVGLFLAWFNLVLYLQRFASYGIYVLMMRKIFVTCIKVLSLFIFVAVAFAAAFTPIMHKIPSFANFGFAMVTSMVMATGEINFNDSFLHDALNEDFKVLRMLLVVAFLVLMPIILMNLLLALAIDDTSSIMQQAKLRKHIQMAKLIIEMERKRYLWPWSSRTKSLVPTLEERPNKKAKFPMIIWEYLCYDPDFTSVEDATTTTAAHDVRATNKRLEREFATMMDMMTEVKDQITGLKKGMKETQEENSRLENPVHSLQGKRDVWPQARMRSKSYFPDEIKARIERKRRVWIQSSNFNQAQSVFPGESVDELEEGVFTRDEWSRKKKETDPDLVELKELHKKVSTGMD